MSKIHLSTGTAAHLAEYGQHTIRCRPLVTVEAARAVDRETLLTAGPAACKACLRLATLEAPTPAPVEVAFDPTPYTPAAAQRDLDPVAERAIRYSITGDTPDQWRDLGHALSQWSRPRLWHSGLRSNGTFGSGGGGDSEKIPNPHLDALAPIASAIRAACLPGYERTGGERRVGSVRLDARDCVRIANGILGGPREPSISAQQISDDLNADPDRRARGEHVVTAQQVGRVWAHLRREIGRWLWDRGLLVRRPREKAAGPLAHARAIAYTDGRGQALSEAPVHLPGHDLEGSKEIEQYLGCSSSAVQRYAGRASAQNPLPITRYAGKLWASRAALDAWRARECRSSAA